MPTTQGGFKGCVSIILLLSINTANAFLPSGRPFLSAATSGVHRGSCPDRGLPWCDPGTNGAVGPFSGASAAGTGGAEGEAAISSTSAVPETKESLFAALESAARRKEVFEQLWNSDYEYNPQEYQELLMTCCRLGYVRPFQDLVSEMVGLEVPIQASTWSSCLYIATSRDYFRLGIACLEKMVETGVRPDSKAINQVGPHNMIHLYMIR